MMNGWGFSGAIRCSFSEYIITSLRNATGHSTSSGQERCIWAEAINGINISDISGISDQDSELDDLEEDRQIKKRLVDEENDSDSDCGSTGNCDSDNSDRYADDTSFNYMSKADTWTDEEFLSFLLYNKAYRGCKPARI